MTTTAAPSRSSTGPACGAAGLHTAPDCAYVSLPQQHTMEAGLAEVCIVSASIFLSDDFNAGVAAAALPLAKLFKMVASTYKCIEMVGAR